MVTVINIDRNGKVIEDMRKVTINLDEFPMLGKMVADLVAEKERKSA